MRSAAAPAPRRCARCRGAEPGRALRRPPAKARHTGCRGRVSELRSRASTYRPCRSGRTARQIGDVDEWPHCGCELYACDSLAHAWQPRDAKALLTLTSTGSAYAPRIGASCSSLGSRKFNRRLRHSWTPTPRAHGSANGIDADRSHHVYAYTQSIGRRYALICLFQNVSEYEP